MSRFDYRKLSPQERGQLVAELLEMIDAVKTKNDLQTFFLQLVTPSEAIMLARRWQIAKRLAGGQSYYRIAQELRVGMSTIEAVDRWLSSAIGDYRQRLTERRAQTAQRRRRRQSRVSVFPNTASFLLLNLLVEGAARVWWAELAATQAVQRTGRKKSHG